MILLTTLINLPQYGFKNPIPIQDRVFINYNKDVVIIFTNQNKDEVLETCTIQQYKQKYKQ